MGGTPTRIDQFDGQKMKNAERVEKKENGVLYLNIRTAKIGIKYYGRIAFFRPPKSTPSLGQPFGNRIKKQCNEIVYEEMIN